MGHWFSYHILASSVIYYWTHARQHGIYLFYIIKKQTTTERAFLFQNLSIGLESRPLPRTLPTLTNTKKAIWRNLLSIQMKQSNRLQCVGKEFWLVQENHATVKLAARLTRVAFLVEWKLTAKAKLNCEIYKSWRNRDRQFLSSEQLCELNSLDAALDIAGVEKVSSENLPLPLATVEICVLCGWRFLNHFDIVVSETPAL